MEPVNLEEFAPVPVGDLALPRLTLEDVLLLLAQMKDRHIKNVDAELKARQVSPVDYATIMADQRNDEYTLQQANNYAYTVNGMKEILSISLKKIGKTLADLPPMVLDHQIILAVRVLHVVADPTIQMLKKPTSASSSTLPESGPALTPGDIAGVN